MKLHEEVHVVSDMNPQIYKNAMAIRFALESFGLSVRFNHLFHQSEVERVLTVENPAAKHLVVCCHGIPGKADRGFRFECLAPVVSGGFGPCNLDLTPETIANAYFSGYDTVISTACASGHPSVVEAIHNNGVTSYVAPRQPIAMPSTVAFVVLLYQRLVHGGNKGNSIEKLQQAVNDAKRVDPGEEREGAHLYELFLAKEAA